MANFTTLQLIQNFTQARDIAIAGVSRKKKSFSQSVVSHLSEQHYNLWLVNPNYRNEELDSRKISDLASLPEHVNHLLILTSPEHTEIVLRQAAEQGIKHIWIQQQSENAEVMRLVGELGLNCVCHQCIFMFTNPRGIHRFHRNLKQFFGKLPLD